MKGFHPIAVLLFGLTACGGGTSPSGGTTPTQPVVPVPTSITISLSSVTLTSPGEVASLTATVKDQSGAPMSSQTVTWTSSDEGVATVSSGTVTAVANGSAGNMGAATVRRRARDGRADIPSMARAASRMRSSVRATPWRPRAGLAPAPREAGDL